MSFINTDNKYINNGIKFYNLGNIYYYGLDVERDLKKAFGLYLKSSSFNISEALNMLGVLCFNGEGTDKDLDSSIMYFEKAKNLGSSTAMFNLSLVYILCDEKKDYEKAHAYLERLVELGYALAKDVLGYLYYNGYGEDKNYEKALDYWSDKDSSLNPFSIDISANDNGYMYGTLDNFEDFIPDPPFPYTLDNNLDSDKVDTLSSFNAPYEDIDSPYTIGNIDNFEELIIEDSNFDSNVNNERLIEADNYFNGTLGELDYVKAFNIYMDLANIGNGYAQLKIANMYKDGLGVEKDYEKSLDWYSKALNNAKN